MNEIPFATRTDSTIALMREGYCFATTRFCRLETDIFRTRVMLKPAFFAKGAEASRQFYHPGRFTRQGAMPVPTIKMLQDFGSVQTLSGAQHSQRKQMFMSLMRDDEIERLLWITSEEWRAASQSWSAEVVLLPEAQRVLCRAVCRWAGFRLDEIDIEKRTREFASEIAGAGNVGVTDWLRREALRTRNERWAREVIEGIRNGSLRINAEAPAAIIASHRDRKNERLPVKVAAVELINILRPTVAIAHFIAHAAVALHQHPDWRDRLRGVENGELEAFVQEVRRLAPFFPLIGGRVREPFEWRGHAFREGDWMLLDIYGTNRDPDVWEAPDEFRPARFIGRSIGRWEFIPQGGGPYIEGHRCPGEWVTIAIMKQAVRFLARDLEYKVLEQDLSIDLGRMPAMPASCFVMREPRLAA